MNSRRTIIIIFLFIISSAISLPWTNPGSFQVIAPIEGPSIDIWDPSPTGYNYNGYDLLTMVSGSIQGGVYLSQGGYSGGSNHGSPVYDVPDGTCVWARLGVGVWGGTPDNTGTLNVTLNGNDLDSVFVEGQTDSNPTHSSGTNVYGSGYGVWWITYNVTSLIVMGCQNNITADTSGSWDGRMYSIFLTVVYENTYLPLIDYWVNEGAACLSYKDFGIDFTKTTFPGTI
ncbi:MAG: DUF3344 domain-containing protein, partial [Promethearchaeota archaeon]